MESIDKTWFKFELFFSMQTNNFMLVLTNFEIVNMLESQSQHNPLYGKNLLGGSAVKVNPLVILLGVPSGFEHLLFAKHYAVYQGCNGKTKAV